MSQQQTAAERRAARGDSVLEELARVAIAEYGARGIVTMIVNEDNSFRYIQHGLTHAQTNNALAVGIHMNMNDHDRKAAEAALAARDTGNQESR